MGISTEKADAGITADRLRFVLRDTRNLVLGVFLYA